MPGFHRLIDVDDVGEMRRESSFSDRSKAVSICDRRRCRACHVAALL